MYRNGIVTTMAGIGLQDFCDGARQPARRQVGNPLRETRGLAAEHRAGKHTIGGIQRVVAAQAFAAEAQIGQQMPAASVRASRHGNPHVPATVKRLAGGGQLLLDGRQVPLRLRSIAGLVPLFTCEVLEDDTTAALPGFRKRLE